MFHLETELSLTGNTEQICYHLYAGTVMNMSQNMEFVHVLGIQSTVPEKKEIKTVKQAKIKNLLLKIKELQDC